MGGRAIKNRKTIYWLCLLPFLPLLASGESRFYRLSWRGDPATTMVVGWTQVSGNNPEICYGRRDFGASADRYPLVRKPDRVDVYLGMTNCFARLEKLRPDTAYYFVVRDSEGTGRRFWFRTAPATPKPLTFVCGGDSRLDYDQSDSIRAVRVAGNRLVAKLRPLFVLYGGDYVFNQEGARWKKWLEDWELTFSADGRIPPIVPVHGNHECYDLGVLSHIFDTPNPQQYQALDFGGKLLRVWVLNSELGWNSPEAAAQNRWLEMDLESHRSTRWKVAAYHRSMRPHSTRKPEGNAMVAWWAGLFYEYGMDLASESDTHLCKRTYPIRPSTGPGSFEGFVRDDARGTVFIGEGSWAAPMKMADDSKPWTMAAETVNQFKWIKVSPKAMEIRSVLFENVEQVVPLTETNRFEEPKGMVFWEPESGRVLRLPFNPADPGYSPPPIRERLFPLRSSWEWSLDGEDWHQGTAPLGYGDDKVATRIARSGQKPRMAYFRKTFHVAAERDRIEWAKLLVQVDDGCAIFLNGREVFRLNLPPGELSAETWAVERVGGARESALRSFRLDPALLKKGENTLQVRVFQHSPNSSDLLFDSGLELGIRRTEKR